MLNRSYNSAATRGQAAVKMYEPLPHAYDQYSRNKPIVARHKLEEEYPSVTTTVNQRSGELKEEMRVERKEEFGCIRQKSTGYRTRNVTPEERKFRYLDDLDGTRNENPGRRARNYEYSYGKVDVDEMGQGLKEESFRIPSKSSIGEQSVGAYKRRQNKQTERTDLPLRVQEADNNGFLRRKNFEMEKNNIMHRIDRLLKSSDPHIKKQETNLPMKEEDTETDQTRRVSSKTAQELEPTPKQMKEERPMRLKQPLGFNRPERSVSPVNYASQKEHSLLPRQLPEAYRDKKAFRYPFQSTSNTHQLKECRTTDNSSDNYVEEYNISRIPSRQLRNLEKHELKPEGFRQTKVGILSSSKENRTGNVGYERPQIPNVGYSRKLDEYEEDALKKIRTINELNNKIGERIKNILKNFDS